MQIDQSVIDGLVTRPTEGLTVEVKRWIDPDTTAGAEKIVKAALALRNRNGGYLVIGFDDKTLSPDTGNQPLDIRSTFHLDKIHGLERIPVMFEHSPHGERSFCILAR